MSIWFRQFTLDEVRKFQSDTMGEHLGIEITAIVSCWNFRTSSRVNCRNQILMAAYPSFG